jgi:hypothetical protein
MELVEKTPAQRKRQIRAVAQRLRLAELVIEGSTHHPELVAAMEPKGYHASKRAEGVAALTAVRAALGTTQLGRAAQYAATDTRETLETPARLAYRDLAADSRTLFPLGSTERALLGLIGKEPRALATFLRAADTLFDGAQNGPEPLRVALAEIGYTARKLASERAKIDALKDAENAQEAAKASAQDLTPTQTESLRLLDAYVSRYRRLAKTALRDRPRLLEAITL